MLSGITSGFTGHERKANHFTPARMSTPCATFCYPAIALQLDPFVSFSDNNYYQPVSKFKTFPELSISKNIPLLNVARPIGRVRISHLLPDFLIMQSLSGCTPGILEQISRSAISQTACLSASTCFMWSQYASTAATQTHAANVSRKSGLSENVICGRFSSSRITVAITESRQTN